MNYIGVDLGGSHIGAGLVNESGEILNKIEKDVCGEDTSETIVKSIVELIEKLETNLNENEIKYVGIGVPGLVYKDRIYTPNLPTKHFDLKGKLQKHISLPIYLENDANCAAIAEFLFGAIKGCNNAIVITIGTSLGTGIIINKTLYKGFQGMAGELGWIRNETGIVFRKCGLKLFKEELKQELNLPKETKGKDIVEILLNKENNSANVTRIVNEYAESLSILLYNAICILSPEKIALGGSFVHYKDIFLDKIKNNGFIKGLEELDVKPEIDVARLKNDAGIIGAAMQRLV